MDQTRTQKMIVEIEDRFQHHPPEDEKEVEIHAFIRAKFEDIATELVQELPEQVCTSREFAVTLTKIEEAMMWCNAAYARNKYKEVN